MSDGLHEFAQLSQKLFNVPLMIRPEKAEMICAALMDRLGVVQLDRIDGTSLGVVELREQAAASAARPAMDARPYEVADGVAIIPVQGSLAQRVRGLQPRSGMVGYNQIGALIAAARADTGVAGIFLDVDSPGGEVAGCFDLARYIASDNGAKGGKPVLGFANEQACSAGYAVISSADRVWMPETGVVGSVGVWVMLAEFTRKMKKDGIKVAMRRAGDRKARGGPFEPWDDKTLEKIDGWIEDTRRIFAQLVADNREMKVEDVLATEGDWYPGDTAMDTGLIDGIGSRDDVFAAFAKEVNR